MVPAAIRYFAVAPTALPVEVVCGLVMVGALFVAVHGLVMAGSLLLAVGLVEKPRGQEFALVESLFDQTDQLADAVIVVAGCTMMRSSQLSEILGGSV